MRGLLAFFLCVAALPAFADVGAVVTYGRMTDAEFYKAVSCGAAPGHHCKRQPVRWRSGHTPRLSVSLATIDPGYPASTAERISTAMNRAIREINGVGAAIRLKRLEDGSDANITIRLFGTDEGRVAMGTGIYTLEGSTMSAGYVSVDFDSSRNIRRGQILFSADIGERNVESIVLEEMTQSLGLLFDLDDPAYQESSIFAERGDAVTGLSGQDAEALRRHYPPKY